MDQNSCGRLRHWRNASLLHATKDALFVLVTATSGTSVILFVVSNAVLTLLHLDISVVDLVTSVALRVTGLLAWSQSTARKVLAQVSGRNMRYWRSILGEGDWNAPWSPSTAGYLSQNFSGSTLTPSQQPRHTESYTRHQIHDRDIKMEESEDSVADDEEYDRRSRGRSDEDEEGVFGRMEE